MRVDGRSFSMLHTSDVHIGWTKGDGDRHQDVCLCPAHAVAETARRHDADLLLVAGDLFDHGRVPASAIGATLEALASAEVPVVLIPGNHDVHDERSLWLRAAAEVQAAGVHLLDDISGGEVQLLDGALEIWCQAMDEHRPEYEPLASVPPRPDVPWWIVAGHGHHQDENDQSFRSSPITSTQIAATGADYVALGHWHVRTDVSAGGVPAWYPGAPMGTTTSGTANLVRFGAAGVEVEHVPVDPPTGC